MSDNISEFAKLMALARADKEARELAERERKEREVAPLLGDLFETVRRAKEIANKDETDKKDKVVELVKSLEAKVEEAIVAPTNPETTETVPQVPDDLEKRVMRVIKQLQNDLKTLKSYVEQNSNQNVGGWGGGGSGEVQITRMDDVEGEPSDGKVLVWSSVRNKFTYTSLPVGGGASEEEMPYSKRIDFISDDVLYKGEAEVGALENDPVWRIRKVTIGLDGDVTEIWANGSSSFSHEWVDRLGYAYS